MLEYSWAREHTDYSTTSFNLKSNSPQSVFLMETKVDKTRMEGIRKSCGFVFGIDVDANGSLVNLFSLEGGLTVNLWSYSTNHIDVLFCVEDDNN